MSGRCSVLGAVLRGIEAIPVEVEVVVSRGMPAFNIVGMADAAVQESKERVRAALKESGFFMPGDRILVNLAPSYLRKTGSGFDLAIAVGLLIATGQIDPAVAKQSLFVGELSLDGAVRGISGLLAYAMCARDLGVKLVCTSQPEGLVPVEGLNKVGLRSLRELRTGGFIDIVNRPARFEAPPIDFRDISGNEVAKRALQIAAAGGHGILMSGPPGSGKTMLASRLPTIMPPLDDDEMLRSALVHSVAGESVHRALARVRPFRAPHHSASSAGLVGGGNPVRPGEVSLADMGVLYLDELPEFRVSVLQQLRQPLEEGCVRISRADGTICFPARFMLVAACNPCPCGYFGDKEHECTCSVQKIHDYQNRIGGPLMDRIDMRIDVRRVAPYDVIRGKEGTSSEELREGVLRAREYASWRMEREGAQKGADGVIESCHLGGEEESFFERAAVKAAMSGRGIVRVLSVARTIADMDHRRAVSKADIGEALSLRTRNEAIA